MPVPILRVIDEVSHADALADGPTGYRSEGQRCKGEFARLASGRRLSVRRVIREQFAHAEHFRRQLSVGHGVCSS